MTPEHIQRLASDMGWEKDPRPEERLEFTNDHGDRLAYDPGIDAVCVRA